MMPPPPLRLANMIAARSVRMPLPGAVWHWVAVSGLSGASTALLTTTITPAAAGAAVLACERVSRASARSSAAMLVKRMMLIIRFLFITLPTIERQIEPVHGHDGDGGILQKVGHPIAERVRDLGWHQRQPVLAQGVPAEGERRDARRER